MSSLAQLEQEWALACENDCGLISTLEKKLGPLLNNTNSDYVLQGMALLEQFGSAALLLVLEKRSDRFQLSKKFRENAVTLEDCLLDLVSDSQSDWFRLFNAGFFDGMLLGRRGDFDWNQSAVFQQRLVKESLRMEAVNSGDFLMGNRGRKKMFKVTLNRDFLIGKYQVTQGLWESVMGDNPSQFKASNRPVHNLSWWDCIGFCNKLSEREGLQKAFSVNWIEKLHKKWCRKREKVAMFPGYRVDCNFEANGYRLPTEAEWERAAMPVESQWVPKKGDIDQVAWHKGNSNGTPHGVGQKKGNAVGLYDMSGNVFEWCWDRYGELEPDYSKWKTKVLKVELLRLGLTVPKLKKDRVLTLNNYRIKNGVIDPIGDHAETNRVYRSGSWNSWFGGASVYCRNYCSPGHMGLRVRLSDTALEELTKEARRGRSWDFYYQLGFRLCRTISS